MMKKGRAPGSEAERDENDLPIAMEDLWKVYRLDGWELVPGTRGVDDHPVWGILYTGVYRFEGRLFRVSVPKDAGDVPYKGSVVEVYPHAEAVTVYRVTPPAAGGQAGESFTGTATFTKRGPWPHHERCGESMKHTTEWSKE